VKPSLQMETQGGEKERTLGEQGGELTRREYGCGGMQCNAIAVTSHTHTHKFVSRDGEELAEGRGPDFVLLARVRSALTSR
jgi:hypothetical protein